MADNNGLQVLAGIVPKNQADTFATHFSKYGQGGHVEVANSSERDAITTERRVEGMKVYVQNEGNTYYLKGGIANSNWTNFLFMSTEINPVDALANFGIDQRQFNIVPQVSSDSCNPRSIDISVAIDPFNSNIKFGNEYGGGFSFVNTFANHNANGAVGYLRGINIGAALGNGSSTGSMHVLNGITISDSMASGYTLNQYDGISLFSNFDAGSNLTYYNGIVISPNIRSSNLQYMAGINLNLQLYSPSNGVNVINTQSNAQAGSNVQYWVDIQSGTNFRDGSTVQNYQGVNVSPLFENSSNVQNFTGVNINPNTPAKVQQNAAGLNINMSNIQMATPGINNRPATIIAQNGVKNLSCQVTSETGAFFDNINLDVTLLTIESGKPINNTEILINNNAALILALDDYSVGPFGLGIVKNLAGGQLSIASGKTVESASNYVSGVSIPPQPGDGGTITNHFEFKAIGIFDLGGGNLNVINHYGFYMAPAATQVFPTTNAWGLYIADDQCENFLKKSLIVGGSTGKVSNAGYAIEIGSKKAFKFTPMTINERDALFPTPEEGIFVAITPDDMGTHCLNYYDGNSWKEIAFV